jgi:chemotaxis signal transduction protein
MRARALARQEEAAAEDAETLATFTVGGHALGVPLERVLRVSELHHLTEVPGAPPFLLGLTTVDGFLVSLLDLADFLGLSRHGVADVRGLLVVGAQNREIGLGAEQLLGIVDVPRTQAVPLGVTPVLPWVARGHGPYRTDLLLLDVEAIFADARLAQERG